MKKNSMILRQLALCLMFAVASLLTLSGQTYKSGDIYVFEDGSKGVVFYVDPDDPGRGTVVALNDLDGQYALWTGNMPADLREVPCANGSTNLGLITNWEDHGRRFTQVLAGSGVSPAADAIGSSGWYIPDIMQLYKLYAGAASLQDVFTASGGDIVSIWSKPHWSSTRVNGTSNQVFFLTSDLQLDFENGSNVHYVRLVRDFPDTAAVRVFWADNPPKTDTVVRPETTTAYQALAVYRSDTLPLTAVVTVLPPVTDTLYDTTFASSSAYSSSVLSRFDDLDVSISGSYEYADTLQTVSGCDSVVILKLTVLPCVSDFTFTCPPDVYDTLAFGDCVMQIYPAQIGEPVLVNNGEWPITVSNDLPADMLFEAGDHTVTWTASDTVCGGSVTCAQHVVVVFPQCPDAVDCEGNVYHGVRIGCDCWTQRNLESKKYSDCADISGVYEYASWRHPDTAANVAIFGRLYSFEAAVRDSADNGHGHIQGICPDGWYLPTPEKYEELDTYGASALKSPLYWIDGGGDNSTGFTALPAGFYNGEKDRYEGMLTEAYFWSVRNTGSNTAKFSFIIRYLCDSVLENEAKAGVGYSVRCIKER